MNTSNFENLDLICAKAGKDIGTPPSKDLQKAVTDALAVLEEQGVYALFLYLKSKTGNQSENISKPLHDFLCKQKLLSDKENVLESSPQMFNDIDKLLFARDLLRQTLVYARYHAKCEEKKKDEVTP